MKTLAKGTNSDCIFKLIKVLLNTQQTDYDPAVQGDTSALHDIADELDVEKPLFSSEEALRFNKRATGPANPGEVSEDEIQFYKSANLPKVEGNKLVMPSYVTKEMKHGLQKVRDADYRCYTGSRSAMFDELLNMENPTPKHML